MKKEQSIKRDRNDSFSSYGLTIYTQAQHKLQSSLVPPLAAGREVPKQGDIK